MTDHGNTTQTQESLLFKPRSGCWHHTALATAPSKHPKVLNIGIIVITPVLIQIAVFIDLFILNAGHPWDIQVTI